jgi:hypothetical protein
MAEPHSATEVAAQNKDSALLAAAFAMQGS